MDELLVALNKIFWKVPPPQGYDPNNAEEVAGFWVAELADAGIHVRWDANEGFVRE